MGEAQGRGGREEEQIIHRELCFSNVHTKLHELTSAVGRLWAVGTCQ